MTTGSRIIPAVLGMLVLACMCCGTAAAVSLGTDWKDRPFADSVFSGVRFSDDGTLIYAGGDQVLLRSWDGSQRWGGRAGSIAAMSGDGEFVVSGIGQSIILLDKTMVDNWSRTMGGQVRAVAISRTGSFVISADDQGNYNSWAGNGEFTSRTKDNIVKKLAISPTGNIVVATTDAGVRIFSPGLGLIWSDNKTSDLDSTILISGDGSTIITAGGNRVSSHTSAGDVNWVVWPTTGDIIDIACNQDCSAIILGSQDGTVVALDRYGKTRWTYKAGQWITAVGISQYGTVIGAGSLDGTVYLLDRTGKVQTQKKMDTGIRPRSLAVSPDGTRIAVADQISLYGLAVMSDPNPTLAETFSPPPLDPVKASQVPTTVTTTPNAQPETTEVVTLAPVPAPTQKSEGSFLTVLGAWAVAVLAIVVIKR